MTDVENESLGGRTQGGTRLPRSHSAVPIIIDASMIDDLPHVSKGALKCALVFIFCACQWSASSVDSSFVLVGTDQPQVPRPPTVSSDTTVLYSRSEYYGSLDAPVSTLVS
jgi:hypothetical protein